MPQRTARIMVEKTAHLPKEILEFYQTGQRALAKGRVYDVSKSESLSQGNNRRRARQVANIYSLDDVDRLVRAATIAGMRLTVAHLSALARSPARRRSAIERRVLACRWSARQLRAHLRLSFKPSPDVLKRMAGRPMRLQSLADVQNHLYEIDRNIETLMSALQRAAAEDSTIWKKLSSSDKAYLIKIRKLLRKLELLQDLPRSMG